MPDKGPKIGWIGTGRMGYPMAERLLKAGYDVSIWNRTRAKAEPLAKVGGKIVDQVRPHRIIVVPTEGQGRLPVGQLLEARTRAID